MKLTGIRTAFTRYTVEGPIPITFEVKLTEHGNVGVTAVAQVIDVDVWRRTRTAVPITVRHYTAISIDADVTDVEETVKLLVQIAYRHEMSEWLTRDGGPVNDPHHGATRD